MATRINYFRIQSKRNMITNLEHGQTTYKNKTKQKTPWSESASELYRPSDRTQSNERSKGKGDRNNPTTRQMRCRSGAKMRRETAEHSPINEGVKSETQPNEERSETWSNEGKSEKRNKVQ
jgi:hypothetical protein